MRNHWIAVIAALAFLGGCNSADNGASANGQPAAPAIAPGTTITGTVTIHDQVPVAAGAKLDVRLVDVAQPEIAVAENSLDVNGTPVLRAVATDGHRMARAEVDAPEGSSGMPGIIIPKKTVGEVQKLLEGADGDVAIEVSDTKIRFTLGSVVLLSKLIEGTFPDYDRVTPKNNDKQMNVDRVAFQTAVDRVSTIASDRGGKAVKLSMHDGQLELSVTNPDHGTATEELPVEFEPENFEIGFNARYLLDIIGQIRSDNAVFLFNDAGSPTLVREDGEAKALYVLMPMRV